MKGEQIMITTASLSAGFTLVPDFLLDNDCLSPDAMFLAADLLRERGNRRTDTIIVSKRMLARKMGGSAGQAGTSRIRRAKAELVEGFPSIFQLLPGDSRTSKPETITVNGDEMLLEHGRYVARREYARAGKSGRTPRAVTVRLSDGRAVSITPDGAEDVLPEVGGPLGRSVPPPGIEHPTPGTQRPNTKTLPKDQEDTYLLSVFTDGRVGETTAETDEQSHPVKASSTPVKVKKERKSQGSGTASPATELHPFLDVWNAHRNPYRMSQHRALGKKQVASLREMVEAHGGDVEAALASWTLAVQKVAAVDCRQVWNFWGKPSTPRGTLINLSRNWDAHAVDFEPVAAPATVTGNWTPPEDIL